MRREYGVQSAKYFLVSGSDPVFWIRRVVRGRSRAAHGRGARKANCILRLAALMLRNLEERRRGDR